TSASSSRQTAWRPTRRKTAPRPSPSCAACSRRRPRRPPTSTSHNSFRRTANDRPANCEVAWCRTSRHHAKRFQPETDMPLDTLHALLIDELKDLYSAENQLLKALPR